MYVSFMWHLFAGRKLLSANVWKGFLILGHTKGLFCQSSSSYCFVVNTRQFFRKHIANNDWLAYQTPPKRDVHVVGHHGFLSHPFINALGAPPQPWTSAVRSFFLLSPKGRDVRCMWSIIVSSPWDPSSPAEHLEEGSHWVHAVEKVHGNGKIENCGPYAEAEGLLLQSVVVLWSAAKGGKDP